MNCKPTITGNDEEFIILGQIVHGHIGECSDNLLLGSQLGALLELEVTNGSREGKVAVDTAKVDKAAGGTDTGLFAWGELAWSTWYAVRCDAQLTFILGLVVK